MQILGLAQRAGDEFCKMWLEELDVEMSNTVRWWSLGGGGQKLTKVSLLEC